MSRPAIRLTARLLIDVLDAVAPDRAPVAQDGHAVGERPHLVHAVRDHDHRRALVAHAAHELEEAVDLGRAERGRRLVQDQDLRVAASTPW